MERRRLQALGTQEIDIDRVQQNLPKVIQQIQEWVLTSGENGLSLMLDAFDAQMVASPARVQIKGTVPAIEACVADDLATIERTSASVFNNDKRRFGRRPPISRNVCASAH